MKSVAGPGGPAGDPGRVVRLGAPTVFVDQQRDPGEQQDAGHDEAGQMVRVAERRRLRLRRLVRRRHPRGRSRGTGGHRERRLTGQSMAIAAGDLPDEPVRAGAALAGDRRSDDAAVDLRLAGLDGGPVAQQPQLREPRGIGSLKVSWTWVGPVASSAPSAGTTEKRRMRGQDRGETPRSDRRRCGPSRPGLDDGGDQDPAPLRPPGPGRGPGRPCGCAAPCPHTCRVLSPIPRLVRGTATARVAWCAAAPRRRARWV